MAPVGGWNITKQFTCTLLSGRTPHLPAWAPGPLGPVPKEEEFCSRWEIRCGGVEWRTWVRVGEEI